MRYTLLLSAATLSALLAISSCRPSDEPAAQYRQPNLPAQPFDYLSDFPFRVETNQGNFFQILSEGNPQLTNAGAALGRVLFYDTHLSLNNRIACGSCHHQDKAFSDGLTSSTGFEGRVTPRNSMAIVNVGINHNLFWDSRVSNVTELVTKPIQNHIEMGMESMEQLERKLAKVDFYPDLFQAAYGSPEVTEARIADALAQFVCAITTTHSRFDQQQQAGFTGFTALENQGRDLFFGRAHCTNCHAGLNFSAPDHPGGSYGDPGNGQPSPKGTANIGLDLVYADPGKESGKFRIPSLRNIALTAPYMHDGRFQTLDEVIEHYNSGVKPHSDLDDNLRNPDGSPQQLGLNALEKKALVAFLMTLTDESLLTDERFADPFK
jgi:cytochrome c peroxidase